ncbi:short chain dehydrogenase [Silvimonas sp. JCM 19000]
MKILIIGATGTVGKAVSAALASHELIRAGRSSGDHQVDITDDASVTALFERVGRVDAIVSATGQMHFGPLAEMSAAQFDIGLQHKLLGQVRVALIGQRYLNAGGSITLTGGIVAHEPIRNGANASSVNAALEGFVRGAAIELANGSRINVISPTLLTESREAYGPAFPGFETVAAARVAQAYVRSVEGAQTGRVYNVW